MNDPLFTFKFKLKVRFLLWRNNVQYKYVKYELNHFIQELLDKTKIYNLYWSHESQVDFVMWEIMTFFIPKVKRTNLVARNKYLEKLSKLTK